MSIDRFLNEQGQVTVWPKKHYDKDFVIGYLGTKFDPNRTYNENEVNDILKQWHTFHDWPLLRRELVDRSLLVRDIEGYQYRVTHNLINFEAPSRFLTTTLEFAKTPGIALDIGASTGRNEQALLDSRWQVVAVEPDEAARKILSEKFGNQIMIHNYDIRDQFPDGKFDLVNCSMVLHFFDEKEVAAVIKNMQEHTALNGINSIVMYTDKNPNGRRPYMIQAGKLAKLYPGWKILEDMQAYGDWYFMKDDNMYRRSHNAYFVARKT